MSDIIIRDATLEDCETLAAMVAALLTQHNIAVPGDLADALSRDGFGEAPRFEAMIADQKGEPVGMTLYYPVYRPSLAGHGLLMEDLYVIARARAAWGSAGRSWCIWPGLRKAGAASISNGLWRAEIYRRRPSMRPPAQHWTMTR